MLLEWPAPHFGARFARSAPAPAPAVAAATSDVVVAVVFVVAAAAAVAAAVAVAGTWNTAGVAAIFRHSALSSSQTTAEHCVIHYSTSQERTDG